MTTHNLVHSAKERPDSPVRARQITTTPTAWRTVQRRLAAMAANAVIAVPQTAAAWAAGSNATRLSHPVSVDRGKVGHAHHLRPAPPSGCGWLSSPLEG